MQHFNVLLFHYDPSQNGRNGSHGLFVVEICVVLAKGPVWEDCCKLNVVFSTAWKSCNPAGRIDLKLFRLDIGCWSWKIYFAMMILNIIFFEHVLLLLSHGGNTRTGKEMRT